ncbi:hypothetical protein AB0N06_10170 [Streptomyces sp. NPDC051020]|uniref:hypothetical protein n=1 Tax=Streptomyces sp. NPDC051020 TaxID=3155409 RepID=UPI00341D0D1B
MLGVSKPQEQVKEAGQGEMNTLRGLGAVAVLAGIAYAMTRIATVDQLTLGITVGIVAVSVVTYMASVRRRRMDRRTASGRTRSRRATSG